MVFQNEYLELSEKSSQFAVDLLHQCRTADEVILILRQKQGITSRNSTQLFPRVAIACEHEQKKVKSFLYMYLLYTFCYVTDLKWKFIKKASTPSQVMFSEQFLIYQFTLGGALYTFLVFFINWKIDQVFRNSSYR